MTRWALCLALGVLAGAGCDRNREREKLVESAEFGVLFGGEIQDRPEIPRELDTTVQELGLRVRFARPLRKEAEVSWEVEKPSGKVGLDGGTLYAAELGRARAPAGAERIDQKIVFRRGDPLGTWRIKIAVDDKEVYRRSFEVIEASP